MTVAESAVPDGLRVIICLSFDHRASVEEVADFKNYLIECACVINAAEVSGSFDFMIEAELPDLNAYHDRMRGLARPMARLVERYEANFVCKRFSLPKKERFSESFWIPCSEGLQRIDSRFIDKITTEGDYVRFHVGANSWLLNDSLSRVIARLDPEHFLHVHRSMVVRSDFIERLIHYERRWAARLADGTSQKISKSRVAAVLHCLKHSSAKIEAASAIPVRQIEKPARLMEFSVH